MDQRTRRSPARFLAPLGLIAVIVVFLAIVSGGGSSDPGDSGSSTASASTSTTTKTTVKKKAAVAKKKAAAKRFYTVQTGDTLGGIASKTGVPLETIQSLNPDVDPNSMTTGQKIRLK